MELNQLVYFVTLANIKNFTKASKVLNVSQPALSRWISRLEGELGVQLFHRDSRNVELTEYGQLFLSYADRILEEWEAAKNDIKSITQPDAGVVKLSFMHSLGSYLVPSLIKEFNNLYPKIQFRLQQNHSLLLAEQLLEFESDLCLCSGPIGSDDIMWMPLLKEELFVIVPLKHRLSKLNGIALKELVGEKFITLKPMYGLRTQTERAFSLAAIRPNIAFEGDEILTVASLVAAGLGVSLVPKLPGMEYLDLKFLSVSYPKCTREIGLAWLANKPLSLGAHRFQHFILNKFSKD